MIIRFVDIGAIDEHHCLKTYTSNVLHMTRFWNNLHQLLSFHKITGNTDNLIVSARNSLNSMYCICLEGLTFEFRH